ncbi:MAG: ATP-binding protein [Muribaculaceae bacterium]|nr:ATP-binding protein [Muribaculaceae bacterium]
MEETVSIIERPIYMNQIRPYIGKDTIKVLTGQRRVGKSYILKALANEIRREDPSANFITINLENFAFSHITDAKSLYDEINVRLSQDRKNYIFLDEIQEVENFDRVVRSLALDAANDIYLTGSNSSMLSSEMASRLAGRSIEVKVHPLSYGEFMQFHGLEDSDSTLRSFLRYGGLPYLRNLPNQATWMEYIEGIANAVVFRDVVTRHSVRNTDFLQRLLLFLADNIGQIFTAKKIADYLKSQRQTASVSGVQTYVGYIEEAYIINRSRRWEIEGKRFFEIGEKFFFEDLGIRNSIVGYRPQDISGLMENAVYNHLVINGYKVCVGVLKGGREVDFIAEKGNEKKYIQVAMTVLDEATASREFGNLEVIPDNYEKILVTLRDTFPNTYKGIKTMTLREFLMSL